MDYALIENGLVANVIWLSPINAGDFPNAVALNGVPAAIGDRYDGAQFYREDQPLPPREETISDMHSAFALLGLEGGEG